MLKIGRFLAQIILLIIAFLTFGCFRKKSISALEKWLLSNYSGQFTIIDTRSVHVIKNLHFRSKKSIVADRADTLLQVEIPWHKDSEINLTTSEFDEMVIAAKEKLEDSRALLAILLAKGIKNIACGIQDQNAYILSYNGYNLESRNEIMDQLQDCILPWKESHNYGLHIYLMDIDTHRKEFEDIVPLSLWVRGDNYIERKAILSVFVDTAHMFDSKEMKKNWMIHKESDQIGKWITKSIPEAESWAKSKIKQAFKIADQYEYSISTTDLSLKIKYPYKKGSDSLISGFITGVYTIDTKTLKELKIVNATTDDKEFWQTFNSENK